MNPDNAQDEANSDDVGQDEGGVQGLSWTNYNEEPALRSGDPRYNLDPLPRNEPVPPLQPAMALPEGLAELSEVTGLPVITEDRTAQVGQGEMIAQILLAFLPNATTEADLVAYWKDNHDALNTLKATDVTAHTKIVLAFRDRRAEITAAKADG
jgi:hypothetical protein